jgi:hypothetical protein
VKAALGHLGIVAEHPAERVPDVREIESAFARAAVLDDAVNMVFDASEKKFHVDVDRSRLFSQSTGHFVEENSPKLE